MLPPSLYSAAQVRELDRRAIDVCGIAGAELMERAGAAAFRALRAGYPRARRIAVVCGPGNNGGDGYIVAYLVRAAGLEPHVFVVGDRSKPGDAVQARAQCEAAGIVTRPLTAAAFDDADVVVDALLGIGLERPVEGEWQAAIQAINASGRPIVAIDIPSGLHADTGAVMGLAVRADMTVCFIGLKAGLFTAAGREQAGEIVFDDLGVPSEVYTGIVPVARRLVERSLRGAVRQRARTAHKGSFGHVLVIGGGHGMPGAARLCGEAAYRIGAGLVTLVTHPAHAHVINQVRPELLAYGATTAADLAPLLARAEVLALGPGLSQDSWARSIYQAALAADMPMVVDADALNLLAAHPLRRANWVLTPHPGEAARLLDTTVIAVQRDRFAAVRALTERYGGVCVLKGSGTLIMTAGHATVALCDRGNPGMASGGTGDVLTGTIAGLMAQGLAADVATRTGVWLHATASDDAASDGEIGLLASDLIPHLRRRINQLASYDDTDTRSR
ncbi:MAG: NAD(P)H-hydrate dehydratase [Gammaproteobacteria bacterium]|nr:NAD(P)H-hydrate dehydratase [Gammaproteobacteria bacterium]